MTHNEHPARRRLRLLPPPKPTQADVDRIMRSLNRVADDRIRLAIYAHALARIVALPQGEGVEHSIYLARMAFVDARQAIRGVVEHPA